MAIDTHVHAFPSFAARFEEAAARALGEEARRSIKAASAVAKTFGQLLKSGAKTLSQELGVELPKVGIESLAHLKKSQHGLEHAVEMAGSLALAAPILLQGSIEGLLASMDRAGIERSVVIGAPPVASNEWLLGEAVSAARGRIVPVATLPTIAKDSPKDAWLAAYAHLAEQGAAGFKIHPNIDGLPATHPAWEALFEVASATKRFVILHTGSFHVPTYRVGGTVPVNSFEPFFQAFPHVPVCLAHMHRDEPEIAWDMLERYPQLFTDTSWQTPETIRAAIEAVGADRLLLGSDWPLLHADLQLDAITILKRAVGEARVLDTIATRNAERFLAGSA